METKILRVIEMKVKLFQGFCSLFFFAGCNESGFWTWLLTSIKRPEVGKRRTAEFLCM